ncbi:hypothetical protein FIBSPDRAFT_848006 [Athelia psychrophila]|uniref:Uncharacterized protein n=1 Tax=Athelia psychrophila TaxID=1759441 RepID=A0A166VI40_9AGAM|nr:hypothetical protein FIBSPDRAFT_868450 [Fibularhizoctonia sp. CBS 109695]KZP32753.1 hypothetical protein FIBSPDRAFT_848006 [Fibularhizoctonia sp. CBS 109695]
MSMKLDERGGYGSPGKTVCDERDVQPCRAANNEHLARDTEEPVPQVGSVDYDRCICGDDYFFAGACKGAQLDDAKTGTRD